MIPFHSPTGSAYIEVGEYLGVKQKKMEPKWIVTLVLIQVSQLRNLIEKGVLLLVISLTRTLLVYYKQVKEKAETSVGNNYSGTSQCIRKKDFYFFHQCINTNV